MQIHSGNIAFIVYSVILSHEPRPKSDHIVEKIEGEGKPANVIALDSFQSPRLKELHGLSQRIFGQPTRLSCKEISEGLKKGGEGVRKMKAAQTCTLATSWGIPEELDAVSLASA